MAKTNANYEAVYIIDPAVGAEGIAALVEKFKALVEANGTLGELDEWGKRRLAYPINDLLEGHYVFLSFSAGRLSPPSWTVSSRSPTASSALSSSARMNKEEPPC
jgi:small subunit ribosomal protein S6